MIKDKLKFASAGSVQPLHPAVSRNGEKDDLLSFPADPSIRVFSVRGDRIDLEGNGYPDHR